MVGWDLLVFAEEVIDDIDDIEPAHLALAMLVIGTLLVVVLVYLVHGRGTDLRYSNRRELHVF